LSNVSLLSGAAAVSAFSLLYSTRLIYEIQGRGISNCCIRHCEVEALRQGRKIFRPCRTAPQPSTFPACPPAFMLCGSETGR
jgi:hypothetical protein